MTTTAVHDSAAVAAAAVDLLRNDTSRARAAAVGIYLEHLENNIAHPHDSDWPDEDLNPLVQALGDSASQVIQEARALFAAKRLCRALQAEEAEARPDEATTLECSSHMDELRGLLDAFGWGFPRQEAQ